MSTQLEVGKTYVTRSGGKYRIERTYGKEDHYPFYGGCIKSGTGAAPHKGEGDCFMPDGRWSKSTESPRDLIAEAPAEGAVDIINRAVAALERLAEAQAVADTAVQEAEKWGRLSYKARTWLLVLLGCFLFWWMVLEVVR